MPDIQAVNVKNAARRAVFTHRDRSESSGSPATGYGKVSISEFPYFGKGMHDPVFLEVSILPPSLGGTMPYGPDTER
ncbi:hypothetical protein [Pandoraea terrae]|uniref:hypothetical protein n=1 Tax=Pandoraea terrae TaxID=1537710 RepID=UPI001242ED43|nr:hypothetical protein [Pandoraea terrae]